VPLQLRGQDWKRKRPMYQVDHDYGSGRDYSSTIFTLSWPWSENPVGSPCTTNGPLVARKGGATWYTGRWIRCRVGILNAYFSPMFICAWICSYFKTESNLKK
jgi:hypothetical protein